MKEWEIGEVGGEVMPMRTGEEKEEAKEGEKGEREEAYVEG